MANSPSKPLRIGVPSRDPPLFAPQRSPETAAARGHHVEVFDYLRCSMDISAREPKVLDRGRSLNDLDAVIPHTGFAHSASDIEQLIDIAGGGRRRRDTVGA